MTEPTITIASSYVRQIASFLPPSAVDRWLDLSEVPVEALEDATVTVRFATFSTMLTSAAEMAAEPAIGLFLGQSLVARAHGFVGYAALNSGSLREVLEVLEAFVPLRLSVLRLSHTVRGDEVRLAVESHVPLGRTQRPLLEAALLSVQNILAAVSLGAFDVRAVCFPFAEPAYGALARDMAGTEVRYDQPWAGLVLRARDIDAPLRTADPTVFEDAARICRQRLDELEATTTYADRVRRMLYGSDNGFPSLQATARRLHMTPRTLHRRLIDEGTSFRALLDEVRFGLAKDYLRGGQAGLDEIAFLLGYTDPANFRRAFRRWAGMPPSQWRATNGDDAPR